MMTTCHHTNGLNALQKRISTRNQKNHLILTLSSLGLCFAHDKIQKWNES